MSPVTASTARVQTTDHRGGGRVKQEDYIIRIYRRDPQDSRMVVGTVEQVGETMKKGFTDFEELRVILGVPRGRPSRRSEDRPAKEAE